MKSEVLEKTWVLKTSVDEKMAESLSKSLNGFPVVLCKILIQRGIEDAEAARAFFYPDLKNLHDPWLMADMDKAVERVLKAINGGEKILVYGDYDVDGTTSAAMMFKFLVERTSKIDYYIPDRYKEGYGISFDSIDYAAQNKFSLVICLDCGIKAVDKIKYANSKNVDFIICDHHMPGDELPAAVAVLDPKRTDCNYPFKELSGCGVGFKLIQAIVEKLELDREIPFQYLDLVATSIAADIVPMVGENRILEYFGLRQINSNPSPGIAAIMQVAGVKKEYEVSDVVFKIAPRINSAGRMSSGSKAVQILVADSFEEALSHARNVDVHNDDRRTTDAQITQEAYDQISNDIAFIDRCTTVLFHENWHKGVIGIVASRMIERYHRPTIIFTGDGDILSGSARSVKGFNIYTALEACSDLLIQFGGHKYAAGMTLEKKNFEAFKSKFDEVVSSLLEDVHRKPFVEIEAQIDLNIIDKSFVRFLGKFAPFGPGNMKPVFQTSELLTDQKRKITDKMNNDHLKMSVFQPAHARRTIDAIAFGMGNLYEELVEGMPFELLYTLEENHWREVVEIQLNVKDLRF